MEIIKVDIGEVVGVYQPDGRITYHGAIGNVDKYMNKVTNVDKKYCFYVGRTNDKGFIQIKRKRWK